jgi:hypothetical protein
MMVHVIAALAPLCAVAFILLKKEVSFISFKPMTLEILITGSVIFMFLVAIPSIMTGIFERGHIYAKWHSTHKYKLFFSLVLMAALVAELWLLFTSGPADSELFGPLGLLIIVVNNIAAFFLGFFGLKISLGSQSISGTSYKPDLFKSEPFDILKHAGERAKEPPKFIDIYEENR